jgi:hypothetical protein
MSLTKRAVIVLALALVLFLTLTTFFLLHNRRPIAENTVGAVPSLLTQLPSNAPVVAYIDVAALRKLQNSPLAAVLGLTTQGPETDKEYASFVQETGFDYGRDLDQAAVAFWPSSLDPAANAGGSNPALAIADGRFDQAKIESYALRVGGRQERHGSGSLYVVPGKPTVAFEFLSPTRIAIASGNSASDLVNSTLDGHRDSAIQARVRRVAGAPVFAVAQTSSLPPSFFSIFANSPRLETLVHSIQQVALAGKPENEMVHVTLDGDCDAPTSATELSTLLTGFRLLGSIALTDSKTRRQLGMTAAQAGFLEVLLKRAQISQQDQQVRVSFDLTPEMLGQATPSK